MKFILIDFENVQPKNVELLAKLVSAGNKIKIFLGANQTKISANLVCAMQPFGPDVEYIRLTRNGKNALDFLIVYHIGRIVAENPGASVRVISKDTGFDALIKYLQTTRIDCSRCASISEIQPSTASTAEKINSVIASLKKPKATRPRTIKTFRSHINSFFRNQLSPGELDAVIENITQTKTIQIVDGKIQYNFK